MSRIKLLDALQAATARDLEEVQARIEVLRAELKALKRVEEILSARFGQTEEPKPIEPAKKDKADDPRASKPRVVRTRLAEPTNETNAIETDKKVLATANQPAPEPKNPGEATKLYQQRLAAARYLRTAGQARPILIGNNCSIPPTDLALVFRCDWFLNIGDYIGLTEAGKAAVCSENDQNCQPGRKVTV